MKTFSIACTLLLGLVPTFSLADSELAVHSYTVTSPDKRYVFVMIAPGENTDYWLECWMNEKDKEILRIRSKYKVSGLYLNDGSTDPLWTVDWCASSVIVPSDGIHLIRPGPWAQSAFDEALTFYANGKKLRSYQIREIVDFPWLVPHSISHFRWRKSQKLNDEKRTLAMVTLHLDRYVFDITTGKVVASFKLSRFIVFGIVIIVVLLVWARWRRKAATLH